MITKLKLKNFKSFEDVEIKMGPVTTLIGTNASGKSNIKDALRLLHGISRDYTLAEAIGEKWVESGVLQWKGIRGGTREMVFNRSEENWCEIGFEFEWDTNEEVGKISGEYSISIELEGRLAKKPKFRSESLHFHYMDRGLVMGYERSVDEEGAFGVLAKFEDEEWLINHSFEEDQAILSQLPKIFKNLDPKDIDLTLIAGNSLILYVELNRMRFFDLSPDVMRNPSTPGQKVLSDRGENLSSVLYDICESDTKKQVLLQWIRDLTPQDVADFNFFEDHQGKVLVELVDSVGNIISAHSASDGTLRFLATVAALLSKQAGYYFFEEVENGIHPSRLHLLIQLMEQRSREANVPVMLSTHSPQLLSYLNNESQKFASLVYRTTSSPSSQVISILDIPYIKDALESQDVSEMHASGWFENVMEFMDPNAQEDENE